ncbi:C1 family peptidase [Phaeocystidibacter luteus]|uniref:Aminopeptidase n=1 Tax=Phaeocystidibacter luteus TaxID=911197 RepID=A0A6N6RLD3_9FLAO|nr:C1 family peptidase [Phaeocystidibacter luteus]KAB2814383.1 aminopeptidase [Phaeocystidibacter luteus]
MKKMLIPVLGFISLTAFGQDNLVNQANQGNAAEGPGYEFETIIDLDATAVKNQASSGTCWSYATSSFVESEMIRMGKDPIDLSEMFTVRQVYIDKAEKYVRLHGHLNFAQGGALPDVMYVLDKYGAVPQDAYRGLNYGTEMNEHGELESALKGILDAVIENHNRSGVTPVWKAAFTAYLDAYLGEFPAEFEYDGKKYTPRSFADEVVGVNPADYVQLTSWTHYPFETEVQIQVPDNWTWGSSINVELDEMMSNIDNALEEGYTVAWAADIERGWFSLRSGLALAPDNWDMLTDEEKAACFEAPCPQMEVTQEIRQAAYDNYETTDDHAMQITGKVKDQNGDIYYIVKNSWGIRDNDYRPGYLYVSEAYVRYKTISVMMHKEAVTSHVEDLMD